MELPVSCRASTASARPWTTRCVVWKSPCPPSGPPNKSKLRQSDSAPKRHLGNRHLDVSNPPIFLNWLFLGKTYNPDCQVYPMRIHDEHLSICDVGWIYLLKERFGFEAQKHSFRFYYPVSHSPIRCPSSLAYLFSGMRDRLW